MIQLITADRFGEFLEEIAEMHRLRYRVFKERLGWDVETTGDLEVDSYDSLKPAYLLLRGRSGSLTGCVRLLPSTGPTMLRDTFPALLDGAAAPSAADVWESSRFGLDIHRDAEQGARAVALPTYELFAGMVEFGLKHRLSRIVTVTDARMERILRRAAWPLERIGQHREIGKTSAVAGYLEVSRAALMRLRASGEITGPVLWAPVVDAAA
ncbi:MAG: acyl-homoserine-lactone synthase [Pseudomonadota bacterium]